ncbi:MAG: type II secretion system protein [Minisyncoccota bacterium]
MKKNQYRKDSSRGFTLIELLVVIAIIGVLSSIVLASLNTAKYKANDAKRRSDLLSLQTALELYHVKHNAYPSTGGVTSAAGAPATNVTTNWIPGLVADGDISQLPQDPTYPQKLGGFCATWPSMYVYKSNDGTGYYLIDLCAVNSSQGSTLHSDALYDTVYSTPTISYSWRVCSGAECGQF